MNDSPSNPPTMGQPTLAQALVILRPLVRWLLRSGVGYAELATALKPVFLEQAQAELGRLGVRPTDSALSLLSGLHRKDIRSLSGAQADPSLPPRDAAARLGKPTPASQVVTRWLASGLPDTLAVAGPSPSFEALARAVSSDVHPRSVLQELLRLGIASEADGQVTLQRQAFVPDARHDEARQLLAGSVADHLAAGVHNLDANKSPDSNTLPGGRSFLEQSVFADGLHPDSVAKLEQLANGLWREVLSAMVQAAVPLCEQDEPLGGDQRIRLGMFCFSEAMAQPGLAGKPGNPDKTGNSDPTCSSESKPT